MRYPEIRASIVLIYELAPNVTPGTTLMSNRTLSKPEQNAPLADPGSWL